MSLHRFPAMMAAVFFVFSTPVHAGESEREAYEPMTVFAELAGRVWRGEGTGPDGQPIVDIARYEMILGGRAFQATHKLEGGTYGGRTIIFFDEGAKDYIFHYFTTAGFHTTGTITPTETGFTSIEKVIGHEEFAAVEAELFLDEGQLRVVSTHVTHAGERSSGDALVYREIDAAGVSLFGESDRP